jgi:hypothetical protein
MGSFFPLPTLQRDYQTIIELKSPSCLGQRAYGGRIERMRLESFPHVGSCDQGVHESQEAFGEYRRLQS